MASPVLAWEGARLRRMEAPNRSEVQRQVQIPILSYQPAAPQVDRQGRIWLYELGGTIRAITPYLGETGRWQLSTGTESSGIETPDGALLVVSRDGRMHRIDPETPLTTTVVSEGLPTAVGVPCRAMGVNVWADARGGVSLVDDEGEILARYEDELYKRRRLRGGAAVGCHQEQVFVGIAGGKIASLQGSALQWAESPGVLAGATFAPRAVLHQDRWLVCTREELCFAVNAATGLLNLTAPIGSYDGPHVLDGRVVIADNKGSVHILDDQWIEIQKIFVEAGALWLAALPDAKTTNPTANVVWVTTTEGNLYRLNLEAGRAERVYSAPSGFSTGGLLLGDATALIPSNFGTVHIFTLR